MARTATKPPVIPLDYGDALRRALKEVKLTTKMLADSLDMDNGSISKYMTGQQLPPFVTFEAIESELRRHKYTKGLYEEWQKVLPAWENYLETRRAEKPLRPTAPARSINIEGYIAAGKPIEPIGDIEPVIIPVEMLHRPKLPAFALRVRGDSMEEDRIFDGDIIVLQNYTPPRNGMIAAVVTDELGGTCKRWYRYGKTIELLSANAAPEYQKPFVYDEKEVEFKGLVVGVMRFFKP